MNVSYDVTGTLRAEMVGHPPVVLVYDARGNGGGSIAPTLTGDHQNRITDYTAILVEVNMEDMCMATGQANAEIMTGGVSNFEHEP